ncbi:MAG: histidinol dehydrogenase [Chloroflexi bacterium]|nr:histidinol dehydrogenase [Chloroflexota bacterium]
MRIARGVDEARNTVLRRAALESTELPPAVREDIRRVFGAEMGAEEVVERILREVWEEGDAAVVRYNRRIDGVEGDLAKLTLQVSRREIEAAYEQVDAGLVEALRLAAERVRGYHEEQLRHAMRSFLDGGLGQAVRPVQRVGIYAPGTSVVYPSTLLMTAIPARVAGVAEVFAATPTFRDGTVAPVKLVAADIAGVDRVYRAGGAQAIGAFTYGTESIPKVDKICWPGNIFVTLAKKKVFGYVGIDGMFGPSETLIIADDSADPALVAADLLAAAEHDALATAVLVATSEALAGAVSAELQAQLKLLERRAVAAASLEARGGIVVVDELDEAVELADEFAPEHLCLHVADPERLAGRVRNAGCVFLGGGSAESFGDYAAGPSHVLPTGGSARFASPLGVGDFLKATGVVRLDAASLLKLGKAAAAIARAEGLTGHARAIERRLKGET